MQHERKRDRKLGLCSFSLEYTCLTEDDARGLPVHGAEEMYPHTPTRTVSMESMLDRRTRNLDKRGLMWTDPVEKNLWQ